MQDQLNTISSRGAITAHGSDVIDAVLAHNRHRTDEQGCIYWVEAELAELVEVLLIEAARQADGG